MLMSGPGFRSRCHPPRRAIRPGLQCIRSPGRGFVRVANVAGVGNLQRITHCRSDKMKGVAANIHIAERLGDFGHVAGDALAPLAVRCVMRMCGNGGGVRPIGGVWTVTVEAQLTGRLAQVRGIARAMHVVARETRHPVHIHQAGDEIISLHPVLVRRAIGEMGKCGVAQLVFLQSPVVAQFFSHLKSYRPVVIFSLNWICRGPALRVALDARIVGGNVI